ncbi:hypothetical protein ANN_17292 [Periplaneta americana]|uniref:Odorant receptor n=1 Tax=Periplaneta americana TaxID=6978 RepID=A0ABQ8SSI9_PERAM|nr:hypothetical protein ANN_17292 [Periplaneta americana]
MILSEERLLSIDAWYPYDWSKSPAYELTNITQFIATAGLCATLYAFPTFYATLIVIGCSQLEKLGINLSNIKQKHISAMIKAGDDDLLQLETSQRMYAHMQEELNKCIRLHQVIIRFTKELEDIFSTFFVGVFLILMLSLCFASYTAVLTSGRQHSQKWIKVIRYNIKCTVVLQAETDRAYPPEATVHHSAVSYPRIEKVREAAWDCDWVGAPVPFQRSLSFVIAIANKELVFTVGKCVPVSKETMMSDPVEDKRDNYFNERREASRTLRNKKRGYLKEKLNEVETNSKNKNIRDLYKGVVYKSDRIVGEAEKERKKERKKERRKERKKEGKKERKIKEKLRKEKERKKDRRKDRKNEWKKKYRKKVERKR